MSSRPKPTRVTAGDVQLEVPPGYAVKLMLLTTAPEASSPDTLPFARNVMVARETVSDGTTAEQLCAQQLQQLARNTERYQHVETKEALIDGVKCPLAEIRGAGPGGLTYASLLAFRVHGTSGFVLSASNREGPPFERTRRELLAVLQSFKLKET